MKTILPALTCVALFTMEFAASAATIVIDTTSDGHSRLRTDGVVVDSSATNIVGEAGGTEYRTFLSFGLPEFTEPVASLILQLKIEAYNNGATASTFGIYDYLSYPPSSIIGGDSRARFDDLGSGVLYGIVSINSSVNPAGSFLEIPLNGSAIAALNSGSGVFTFPGGSRSFIVGLTDVNISGADSYNVRFVHGSGAKINQLVAETVPEPSSLALLGFAMSVLAASRRSRS